MRGRLVKIGGSADGYADYIVPRTYDPTIVDYRGESENAYYEGGTWSVHTEASYYNPNETPQTGWINSNSVNWHL